MSYKAPTFESLPVEIRVIIYKYLFSGFIIEAGRVKLRRRPEYSTRTWLSYRDGRLAILSTSKQLYNEAQAIFTACLTFRLNPMNLDSIMFGWQTR
jgi:hypothetical protein